MNTVTVVYAYDRNDTSYAPWIYGVYEDDGVAFQIQEEMQNSKEYGHLIWSNNTR
mgnify:FL=1